jgi:hypothetical protein
MVTVREKAKSPATKSVVRRTATTAQYLIFLLKLMDAITVSAY